MIWRWICAGAMMLWLAWAGAHPRAAADDQTAASGRWRVPTRPGSAVPAVGQFPGIQLAVHQGTVGSQAGLEDGSNGLPNQHGQVWQTYDLSPYTSRVKSVDKPEQAVVDWILRETGTEAWFSEPLGVMCATRDQLRVYHTRPMQAVVSDIVQRFVIDAGNPQVFGVRLITLGSPNWRSAAQAMLRPVPVQTPGVEAWVLSQEDATRLVAELRQRSDAVEHNSPHLRVDQGQTHTIQQSRPLPYVRSVVRQLDGWPNYQLQMGQVEEGITLQLSPLLSRDRRVVDAVIKLSAVQVEKFSPVWIDVPSTVDPRQRTQVQVPQTACWQLHERFRWPVDQVLLISCGLVPAPAVTRPSTPGLATMLFGAARADILLLVEAKGPATRSLEDQATQIRTGSLHYHGRY